VTGDATPMAASPDWPALLEDASRRALDMDDRYLSIEHLLLALVRKGDPETVGLFKARGITPEKVEAAPAGGHAGHMH